MSELKERHLALVNKRAALAGELDREERYTGEHMRIKRAIAKVDRRLDRARKELDATRVS